MASVQPDLGAPAAIIGVGVVGPFPFSEAEGDYLQFGADAVVTAARDARLERADIDGLVINAGGTTGPDYDQLAGYLGLELSASLQTWSHGRFMSTVIYQAGLLVTEGHADVVACLWGQGRPPGGGSQTGHGDLDEELRKGGGPHREEPAVGLTRAMGTAAMTARRYCEAYGVDSDRLFDVVAASRMNAQHYPGALRPTTITADEYYANPYLVEPLRGWDWLQSTAGAVCVLIGRAPQAAEPRRCAQIAGFAALPSGRAEFPWSRPGLGMGREPFVHSPAPDERIFSRSGLRREDVDLFMTHDACSPSVWMALERYGYAPAGEAVDFISDRGIAFDGGFPMNTHGGSLSAGQIGGWLNIAEAVTQLRGEAGARQVPEAAVVHYGSASGDTIMLTRA